MWERLLVATEAPFIALSATIGNPEDFAAWYVPPCARLHCARASGECQRRAGVVAECLRGVHDSRLDKIERAKSRNLQLVKIDERINDLAMHIYSSKALSTVCALLNGMFWC